MAIKIEPVMSRNPQLAYEAKAYNYLQDGIAVPRVYYFGKEKTYNVMVMDLLGPSLEVLLRYQMGTFSLKTVCMLAQEMLLRLEYIHSQSFLHRDIKPDNFVIGMDKMASMVYLIDLGLCKRYRYPNSNTHIQFTFLFRLISRYREDKNLTGTPRYASIANHLGIEQSRRDDLESLGYVLIYFLLGKLPWQGLRADNKKEKYRRILESKVSVTIPELCAGLPEEFQDYLVYCRGLRFDESPDYVYLRGLFSGLMESKGFVNDGVFDWMVRGNSHDISVINRIYQTSDGTLLPCFLQPTPCGSAEIMTRLGTNGGRVFFRSRSVISHQF